MPQMTKGDASRIQSTQAKTGHDTGKGTFAARGQSAADKNVQQQQVEAQGQGPASQKKN